MPNFMPKQQRPSTIHILMAVGNSALSFGYTTEGQWVRIFKLSFPPPSLCIAQ